MFNRQIKPKFGTWRTDIGGLSSWVQKYCSGQSIILDWIWLKLL